MRSAAPLLWAALAGASIGVSGLDTSLWLLGWVGFALLAFSLAAAPSRVVTALAVTLVVVSSKAISLHWFMSLDGAALGADPRLTGAGFIAAMALPGWALMLTGGVAFHGRPWVRSWLPLAWAGGERLQADWTSVATDWVGTQIDAPLVAISLARFGMWLTVLVCLFVLASLGEALARRRPRLAWPAALATVGLMIVPAPDRGGDRRLEGFGAVHAATLDTLPAYADIDGLEVLVWPEVAFAARPHVEEGAVAGVTLDALDGGGRVGAPAHVVGLTSALLTGLQNVVALVEADGSIATVRAKRVLFPGFERAFWGAGEDRFVAGVGRPLMEVAGRRVIPLICGEALTRTLVAEGKAAGGEVLVIVASEGFHGGQSVVWDQVMGQLRARAVEYDLPIVYASAHGRAAFIGADGRILGSSPPGAPSGVLVMGRSGVRDHVPPSAPSVAVVYSRGAPHLRPDCPPGRCSYHALEGFRCPGEAQTLVVAGHAAPPDYLGATPAALAAVVACFSPELLVVDTCFGASTPLLGEVSRLGRVPLVVASPGLVAGRGFRYGAAFFDEGAIEARVAAVSAPAPARLYIGRPDTEAIAEAEAEVAAADGEALRARVRSWSPATLVSVAVGDGEVVAPADWRKIGRPPGRTSRRRE